MGCIFAAFMALFPRLAFFLVWVARPEKVHDAFDTFLVPFFGIFLLPFTTLMWVLLWKPGGIEGIDWLWLGLAAALDVAHWGGSIVQGRETYQGERYPTPWVKG